MIVEQLKMMSRSRPLNLNVERPIAIDTSAFRDADDVVDVLEELAADPGGDDGGHDDHHDADDDDAFEPLPAYEFPDPHVGGAIGPALGKTLTYL